MKVPALACAIYTRKSSEEGLEQGFNSLDAQREACAAFILSQKAMGWVALPDAYDDGGFSGGNVERPGLQRLLADIAAKRVRVVVVHKVDRLTRSLADFAKMVELFDAQGVSFVSVTQQFNTTSSMGRLTLNVLLSFAQFEREVTGERIRDKISASKRKGMWMGGMAPIGYVPNERTLAIDEVQAERVREIYQLYLELDCVRLVQKEVAHRNWTTPVRTTKRADAYGGRPFSRGHLYRILSNPVYAGQIVHKGDVFAGNHPAIIEAALWDTVQARLAANRQGHRVRAHAESPSLLTGLVFDEQGQRLTPSHAKKGTRRYRYYVGSARSDSAGETLRIPAQELELAVTQALLAFVNDESRLLACMGSVEAKAAHNRLRHAKTMVIELKTAPAKTLRQCVLRVGVGVDAMKISVRLAGLWGSNDEHDVDEATTDIDVPVQLQRCGMAMRLIVNATGMPTKREPDATMVALLAKAHDWMGRLTSGRSASIESMAKAERVLGSYVSRVASLACLAPDIVQRIARGEHSPQLNAQRLFSELPLPIDWARQRALLGFDR